MSAPAVNSLNPAIEVSGLSAGYDGLVLLKDVTFNVAPGEIFFVIGGSGCGKTTLLRNMIGLRTPLAGEVRFNGRPFSRADRIERRKILRTFGMLFQSGALWSSLTLRQNVALPLEEYTNLNRREIFQLATFKLAQVGLAGYEDYFPSEISGGMKKRAGLARALSEGRSAGAGLDVREQEPPGPSPLTAMDNVILTPHIAAFTKEGQARVTAAVCQDVASVLRGGDARNFVNFSRPRARA